MPERPRLTASRLDTRGALAAAVALGFSTAALIQHASAWAPWAGIVGVSALVAFALLERRSDAPMLPPSLFRSSQFSGANAVTLLVYAGLGVGMFLVVVNLQSALGYSALEAGTALFPVTVLMLVGSSRAGALAQRVGPRIPMTVGPLVVALGFAGLAFIEPGRSYVTLTLPAATVLGIGLTLTVAPLTAVVLASVFDEQLGIGSGVNNAVARLAGLLAVAVLPVVAGVTLDTPVGTPMPGYRTVMLLAAALSAAGTVVSWLTISSLGSAAKLPARSMPQA